MEMKNTVGTKLIYYHRKTYLNLVICSNTEMKNYDEKNEWEKEIGTWLLKDKESNEKGSFAEEKEAYKFVVCKEW